MDKLQSKLLILMILVLILAGGMLVFSYYYKSPGITSVSTPPPETQPAIRETLADTPPEPKSTTILAPDGKHTLIMTENVGSETTTETFSIADQNGDKQSQIFTKSVPKGTTISVPYNTFSPDDRYIFLKETTGKEATYYSISTKGGDPVNFIDLFKTKYPDFTVTDVTGWGGMTLIVINTDKAEGGIGPSFWFDVTSNSFIRLSTRFN